MDVSASESGFLNASSAGKKGKKVWVANGVKTALTSEVPVMLGSVTGAQACRLATGHAGPAKCIAGGAGTLFALLASLFPRSCDSRTGTCGS